ncbi:Osmoprotectant ABC transporter, substrate-binding protein OsmX [hydrothermal vent metagenome]|uniref:Osmoprotectant ABC transporter, substrate-binding protein OsmX n=1 Tax=hydrothermal vent metagenome TaxID=652676 RepID=A0A3B0U553_9ZZZZ
MKIMTKGLLAVMFSLGAFQTFASEIVVGGKNFTEQLVLTEMTYKLLNDNGIAATKLDGMGSAILRQAEENGQVDVYWEYTGTSLVTYNKIVEKLNAKDTYDTVKRLDAEKGIVWLNPSAANNTYALAVRSSETKLNTLSDLAAAYNSGENIKMGVNAEFPRREDGLIGLQKAYGFTVGRENLVPMDSGLVYQALRDSQVEVGLVFATDGRIKAFDFKVLKDDKGFFPDYALVPTIRQEVLDDNPEIGVLLNKLSATLSDTVMQDLNARVDVEKQTIEQVAEDYLKSQGLI